MVREREPTFPAGRAVAGLLLGLLSVQTALLGILLWRINGLHRLLQQARLAPPGPVLELAADPIAVDPGSGASKGAPGAPVTIVEFSCFTCPSCADLQPTLREVLAREPGRVRLAFRYFPLRPDGKPLLLAKGAECARRQGRFWEAHDRLFERAPLIGAEADVVRELGAVGVDPQALAACLASEEADARVRGDLEAGLGYGVQSTPTLFVNGRRLLGADRESLERAIAESLEKG